jgi:hypothetical protein
MRNALGKIKFQFRQETYQSFVKRQNYTYQIIKAFFGRLHEVKCWMHFALLDNNPVLSFGPSCVLINVSASESAFQIIFVEG